MQLRIFTEPQQGACYDTLLTVARAAEASGVARRPASPPPQPT